jgi:hypothetical protein
MIVSAVSPWRVAFRLERRLPPLVLGPVLHLAFCRFAAICLSVAIRPCPLFRWYHNLQIGFAHRRGRLLDGLPPLLSIG